MSLSTFDRREFLVSRLSTGFALATLPVSASTITTDTSGLDAGEVSISTSDGQMRAALKEGSSAAKASEIVVYPKAGHGFNADYRPWFKQHGAA